MNDENIKLDKIRMVEENIEKLNSSMKDKEYNEKIMKQYIQWINMNREVIIKNLNNLYTFYRFENNMLKKMEDYYDITADKIFSFSLFMTNVNNLSYLIGLIYNYAIMIKHFSDYKMRIYVDFHSIFGSPESFNVFLMFLNILETIDVNYQKKIQFVVFFLNPYFNVNNESIYDNIVNDINIVINYYNKIFYNSTIINYIQSPLLNLNKNVSNTNTINNNIKADVKIDEITLNINYKKNNEISEKSSFSLFTCHIAVNLRFLPINENCEYHVRDLDSRLSETDKNIIKKFNNPKYEYVPIYVFQFYKHYFPYLKWRIDVNPYLAGCFGGDNRKKCMISKELEESNNVQILKKELFFKYILFLSFNCSNLQIGFLNDEFILADIFEKIKGVYSEQILYLNIGVQSNKHTNEYYYGLHESTNYPCLLKLGTPIDILTYQLNGKYLTIDPITDFKIANIKVDKLNQIKNLLIDQVNIYLKLSNNQTVPKLSEKIRENYIKKINKPINDDLESALFFSMQEKQRKNNEEIVNDYFSSIGTTMNIDTEKLQPLNFMYAGYLLADILEDIIFPKNPKFMNYNDFVHNDDNYDRLYNCLYFHETKKTFLQKKINKKDFNRKYVDDNLIDNIPSTYRDFTDTKQIKQELNVEFNNYLKTCKYYPSFYDYIQNIKLYKYISVNNHLIKTGVLIFIKKYDTPIYDKNNNIINKMNELPVHKIQFNIDDNNYINNIDITKNRLRFDLVFLTDTYIYKMRYHDVMNKDRILITELKDSHLENIEKLMSGDYTVVNNL